MDNILYNKKITKDTTEQSIERYSRLTRVVNDDDATLQEKKDAREEAVFYMRDLVKNFIAKKYGNYIKTDPNFYDDLFMASMEAIISYLPQYDSNKGAPSTYFGLAIRNALYTETTRKFGKNSPQMQLARKVEKVNEQYEARGKVPSVADLARILGKTEAQIRDILCLISLSGACALDNVAGYQEGVLSGNQYTDENYRNPADVVLDKITNEQVVSRVASNLSEDELVIFEECIIGNKHYSDLGIESSKYHRVCAKAKKFLQNDPVIIDLLKRG